MAAEGGTRFRAEIAAPSVTTPLIVVAAPDGVLAALVGRRLYFRGDPGAPLLKVLAGVPVEVGAIPRLLGQTPGDPPAGCAASTRSWRLLPHGGQVPATLIIRCGDSGFRLHLSGPHPLDSAGSEGHFSLEPPAGYRETGLDEFIDSLKRSSRPDP